MIRHLNIFLWIHTKLWRSRVSWNKKRLRRHIFPLLLFNYWPLTICHLQFLFPKCLSELNIYDIFLPSSVSFLKWRYTPQPGKGLSMPLNPYDPLHLFLLQTFSEAWELGSDPVITGPATVCSSLTQPGPESMPGHGIWQGIHIPAITHRHKYSPHHCPPGPSASQYNDLIPTGVSWRARRSRT